MSVSGFTQRAQNSPRLNGKNSHGPLSTFRTRSHPYSQNLGKGRFRQIEKRRGPAEAAPVQAEVVGSLADKLAVKAIS